MAEEVIGLKNLSVRPRIVQNLSSLYITIQSTLELRLSQDKLVNTDYWQECYIILLYKYMDAI